MSYTIRPAVQADLDRIREIYEYARSFMRRTGNPNQWGTGNPPLSRTQKDIEEGRLFVITENHGVHGVFYFSMEADPTYAVIYDGGWHFLEPYGVIHRIAGDGSGGIVRAAVEFAEKQIPYLRIDTHEDNLVMQHTLKKNGFRPCGTILLENGDPRLAFDRKTPEC